MTNVELYLRSGGTISIPSSSITSIEQIKKGSSVSYQENGAIKTVEVYEAPIRIANMLGETND